LRNLRDLIGEQAIQAGLLPPHIPIWRFQSIDWLVFSQTALAFLSLLPIINMSSWLILKVD